MKKISPKQPDEKYRIKFDFSEDYELLSDTIASATAVMLDTSDDSDVSATMLDNTKNIISGTTVYIWVQAGTDDTTYKLTVLATGDTYGEVYELDIKIPVRAI